MAASQPANGIDAVELHAQNSDAQEQRRLSTLSRASIDSVSAEELRAAVTAKSAGPVPAWLLIGIWISLSTGVSYN